MAGQRIKLWDLPVRVVHWSFVALMPALWWTAEHDQMAWHKRLGYLALGLILFRIYWGFFGSSTARFAGFVKGPKAVFAYVRTLFAKGGEPVVGHNPMGGWSVVILLLLILSEVKLGLFSVDVDGIESGPLASFVSFDLGRLAAHLHHTVFNLLLAFIALHILAVVFYLVAKRENLIRPMLSGWRDMAASATPPTFAPVWRLVVGVGLAIGLAWWISAGLPLHLPGKP